MNHNQKIESAAVFWESVQIAVSSEDPSAVETSPQSQGGFPTLMQYCHLLLTAGSGAH